MASKESVIGLIGLGTMGANLALNIADNGFDIAVFNRTTSKTHEFHAGAGELSDRITPCETLEAFVASLQTPRNIILMVPAGPAVDDQIAQLTPLLDSDDLIIDAGNANFHDTNRRAESVTVNFMGIGVSGGSEGARYGPSIMGGGPKESWDRVSHILRAIAAKHEGQPCATWMGEAGAGHFVKMVHNGIEYADMQMIAEIYGIMRDGYGQSARQVSSVFGEWNEGALKSYLVEISSEVSSATDEKTGKPVIDVILDRAGQKGTGRWTAIEAQHLATPVSAIEAAVGARNLSSRVDERGEGSSLFGDAPQTMSGTFDAKLHESALIAGKIVCYAQGFVMLREAAKQFGWAMPLGDIAEVWRAGCIIRSAMLDDMAKALRENPDDNLMRAPYFAELLAKNHDALRTVVSNGVKAGHALPALSAALSYFDQMRTLRTTANMLQAQRDFFGAHSFERIGEEGAHHGPWVM